MSVPKAPAKKSRTTSTEPVRFGEFQAQVGPRLKPLTSGSFQVTAVNTFPDPDDSADDLDDVSHTDIETPSFSEEADPEPAQCTQKCLERTDALAAMKPVARGRWICQDFSTEVIPLCYLCQMVKNLRGRHSRLEQSQPVVNPNGTINRGVNTQERSRDLKALALDSPRKTPISEAEAERSPKEGLEKILGVKMEDSFRFLETKHADPAKGFQQETAINGAGNVPAKRGATVQQRSPSNNNKIDEKIEEALDTVKMLVMSAVHREVEGLRSRVSHLEGRVNELEIENNHLKVSYLLYKYPS